jgi:hypothetical protein
MFRFRPLNSREKTPVPIEGWVGIRAGLDALKKRNSFFLPEFEYRIIQPVACSLY